MAALSSGLGGGCLGVEAIPANFRFPTSGVLFFFFNTMCLTLVFLIFIYFLFGCAGS